MKQHRAAQQSKACRGKPERRPTVLDDRELRQPDVFTWKRSSSPLLAYLKSIIYELLAVLRDSQRKTSQHHGA